MKSLEQIQKEWKAGRRLMRWYAATGFVLGLVALLYIQSIIHWIEVQDFRSKVMLVGVLVILVIVTNLFCYRSDRCPACRKLVYGWSPGKAWKALFGIRSCHRCGVELEQNSRGVNATE